MCTLCSLPCDDPETRPCGKKGQEQWPGLQEAEQWQQLQRDDLPIYSTPGVLQPGLAFLVQDILDLLERGQQMTMRMIKGLEHLS